MRFVTPDVVRIPLKDGDDGTKNWITVKKRLSVGEEKRFRTAGFKQLTPGDEKPTEDTPSAQVADREAAKIEVDWARLALARVETYLVDWSAKKPDGKDRPVSRAAIEALEEEDFNEIDEAIQAHIKEQAAEKKATAGAPKPALTSA